MGYPALHPITKPSEKETAFAITDIEAMKWIQFLCIGFCTKVDGEWLYRHFLNLGEYIQFIFSKENPRNVFYAHFGGKYDFLFIIKEAVLGEFSDRFFFHDIIPRGSSILSFSLSTFKIVPHVDNPEDRMVLGTTPDGQFKIKDRTIEFRDSAALLSFSLRSLCEAFGVIHQKLDVDYEKITEVTPQLLEYMEHDHKGLYDVMEAFHRWDIIKEAGGAHTIAGQAMKVFRLFLKDPIYSLNDKLDDFVRESYFGGRTEIFKPLFLGDKNNLLSCVDVNSLYPTIMHNYEMPTNFSHWSWIYDPKCFGFYDAEVEVPKDMYIPPLPTMQKVGKSTKLIFPTGRFKGRWSTIELEYAKSLGVKVISTGRGAVFKNGGYLFKEYVDYFYKIRQKAKKESVDDILAKLLMNSCYGRFGLRRDRESIIVDEGQENASRVAKISHNGKSIRLVSQPKNLDNIFSNVAIAAWVTTHSRVYLHKILMEDPKAIYYCDTDSAFTTHEFPIDEKGLGGLKLEYKVLRACFLLPKTYTVDYAELQKGASTKVVMKGFDKKKVQHLGVADFRAALEGELKRMKATNPSKVASFKMAIRKGDFLKMLDEQDREIRALYDKRIIVKTGETFDTKPLHIENGIISNWHEGIQYLHQLKKAAEKKLLQDEKKKAKKSKKDIDDLLKKAGRVDEKSLNNAELLDVVNGMDEYFDEDFDEQF